MDQLETRKDVRELIRLHLDDARERDVALSGLKDRSTAVRLQRRMRGLRPLPVSIVELWDLLGIDEAGRDPDLPAWVGSIGSAKFDEARFPRDPRPPRRAISRGRVHRDEPRSSDPSVTAR